MNTAPLSSRDTPAPPAHAASPASVPRRALVAVEDQRAAAAGPPDPSDHRLAEARTAAWSTATHSSSEPIRLEPSRFGPLVGASLPMREIFDQIARVAPTDAAVLVLGESGTGKELVAEAVHSLSRRRDRPMISINCGAISATLIESELFGHERGSFTGAGRVHRGHFERADGGTLFLDEINEMPYELQVKLLRVLESGIFFRVGGDRPICARVRIVAASKPNLEHAACEGRFRADLLYRLKVFPISLPPLRERRDDLALLVQHFLDEMNGRAEFPKRLAPAALAMLYTHDWPGNVRELKHLLERAFILSDDEIGPANLTCLPPQRTDSAHVAVSAGGAVVLEPGITLADAERLFVLATIRRAGGNRAKAAAMLEISTKALRCRLRRYYEKLDTSPAASPLGPTSSSRT